MKPHRPALSQHHARQYRQRAFAANGKSKGFIPQRPMAIVKAEIKHGRDEERRAEMEKITKELIENMRSVAGARQTQLKALHEKDVFVTRVIDLPFILRENAYDIMLHAHMLPCPPLAIATPKIEKVHDMQFQLALISLSLSTSSLMRRFRFK